MSEDMRPSENIGSILSRVHYPLIVLAVMTAIVGIGMSGLFALRQYERESLRLAARSIAYAAEPAVYFGDPDGVADALNSVGRIAGVYEARVTDATGATLSVWRSDGDPRQTPPADWSRFFEPEAQSAPVNHNGRQIGQVFVRGSADGALAYAMRALLIALCCGGIVTIATRILLRQLHRKVVEPLQHVAEVADKVRVTRDFALRVEKSGITEVDRFASGFNDLLSELDGWKEHVSEERATLAHRAEHDPLTGLGNRSRFERMLGERIRHAAEAEETFAILFIDLDRFKAINDRHGHHAGDTVLREIARRLHDSVRGGDSTFRLGGDEFAILLDPTKDPRLPHQIAARIQAALLPPVNLESGVRQKVSLSIGVAIFPDDGQNEEQLLRRADSKMYQRKNEATQNDR